MKKLIVVIATVVVLLWSGLLKPVETFGHVLEKAVTLVQEDAEIVDVTLDSVSYVKDGYKATITVDEEMNESKHIDEVVDWKDCLKGVIRNLAN